MTDTETCIKPAGDNVKGLCSRVFLDPRLRVGLGRERLARLQQRKTEARASAEVEPARHNVSAGLFNPACNSIPRCRVCVDNIQFHGLFPFAIVAPENAAPKAAIQGVRRGG